MEQRPVRRSRAKRKPAGAMADVIWVPMGAEVVTSSGVEVRYLSTGMAGPAVGSTISERGPAGAASPMPPRPMPPRATPPSPMPPRTAEPAAPRKSERRSDRRPLSYAPSSPGPARAYRGAAAAVSSEQLPVAHPDGPWEIPDAWDLPPEQITTLGPDGEVPVPPGVDAAARRVMALYDMSVSSIQLITSKPDKGGAIWRIETNRGPRSLKLLHREAHRSLFSVGAQEYLVGRGARVPALVRTRGGELCVQTGTKLWIVTDWIEPLVPVTKVDLAGAAALCHGLGEFQRLSQGYVPPRGARYSTRLHRWPKAYRKVLSKIGWFREIAQAYSEFPASRTILSLVDTFEQQARDAIARLDASAYGALTARGEQAWGLVHQDYGFSNGQMGPGGIWIIDLDGVAFDLGIRDLRKLITGIMDDMGVWDVTWIRGMIDAYSQANPIEPDLYQVLLVDLSLPNEFYKHVKDCVTKTRIESASRWGSGVRTDLCPGLHGGAGGLRVLPRRPERAPGGVLRLAGLDSDRRVHR